MYNVIHIFISTYMDYDLHNARGYVRAARHDLMTTCMHSTRFMVASHVRTALMTPLISHHLEINSNISAAAIGLIDGWPAHKVLKTTNYEIDDQEAAVPATI